MYKRIDPLRQLQQCPMSAVGCLMSGGGSREWTAQSNLKDCLSVLADAGVNTSEAKGKAQKKNQKQWAIPNIYSIW